MDQIFNYLGTREPDAYSKITLDDITAKIKNLAKNFKNVKVEFFQTNNEGEIVDKTWKSLQIEM